MNDNFFYISSRALEIVLTSQGADKLFIPLEEDFIDEYSLIQEMKKMVESEILSLDADSGERMVLTHSYKKVIDNLIKATVLLRANFNHDNRPTKYFYLGSQVSMIEQSVNHVGKLRIGLLSKEDMIKQIGESVYVDNRLINADLYPDLEEVKKIEKSVGLEKSSSEFFCDSSVVCVLDFVETDTSNVIGRIVVFEKMLYNIFAFCTSRFKWVEAYDTDLLSKTIFDFMEGSDDIG